MTDVFKSLTQYLKKFSKIYIMTHKNPDFDGLASALCLSIIASSFEKENYIIDTMEPKNNTILRMYQILNDREILVPLQNEKQALKNIDEESLLVILDVHKEEMVESTKLLEKCKNVIVIDHHIKGTGYIRTSELSYINSNISSVTEFMAYYLKYLNKTVNPVIATIMLVGIEIDTNNYKLKTSEKTFEASAFLTSLGADSILKQELLKEDKDAYVKRSYFVKRSYMINQSMALCKMDENIYEPKDLAEIAEQLLQFDGIEVSFSIGKIKDDVVGISARSVGNIDVSKMMERLGGGGHLTDAASQIKQKTIGEVEKMLLEIVEGE